VSVVAPPRPRGPPKSVGPSERIVRSCSGVPLTAGLGVAVNPTNDCLTTDEAHSISVAYYVPRQVLARGRATTIAIAMRAPRTVEFFVRDASVVRPGWTPGLKRR
jgi:hypothetical protein